MLTIGVGACGSDSGSATTTTTGSAAGGVGVTLGDFSVDLATPTLPAGSVTFDVKNAGGFEHELVVMRTSVAEIATKANGEADEESVPEADHMGEVEHIMPTTSEPLTVTLTPGHYTMFCNLSGDEGVHYMRGMHVEFDVA